MAHHGGPSRYVDYTDQSEAGPSGYGGDKGRYPPYEDYDPPDRPPRREKSSERSLNRSRERLDRRDRSLERGLEGGPDRRHRHDRSLERSLDRGLDRSLERLDRREGSLERVLDRRNMSHEQIDSRDLSSELSLERRERSKGRYDRGVDRGVDRGLDIRDRSMERSLDRRDRSVDGSVDRRDRSMERLDRRERRDRSVDRSLDERSVDRRHRSRSRDGLADPYAGQVFLHPLPLDRAPSDRAESEFTVRNEQLRSPALEEEERRAASRAASEIYANTRLPRPHSQMSQYTYRSGRGGSDVVSVKTKTTANGKLVMETMTAPHPCCPNTRSCCCLMVLLNLGLLLITLGFVVVLQLYDPPFVWYVGLSMLIFGFLVLFGSLIYCVFVCREVEKLRPPPGELYWTNHWSKTIQGPEIHYSNHQNRPADYRGSEFSFKTDRTEPSRLTANNTSSSLTRY